MYPDLTFPQLVNRPYFFTNFVTTLDGKVATPNLKGYWPIGSETDYQTLIELRTHADILIHGKTTAMHFKTLNSLAKDEFRQARQKLGKSAELPYLVITNNPSEDLIPFLTHPAGQKGWIATHSQAKIPPGIGETEVIVAGESEVSLEELGRVLKKRGVNLALMEGGPNLLGSFVKDNLLDEIFLTVAPKIFGNDKNQTLTMMEGFLLSPENIKKLKLISVKKIGDEVYLRYKTSF